MTKILIAQGGGPTIVINESLVGAVFKAKENGLEVIGSRYGIKGILKEDFIALSAISKDKLERVAKTPASSLFSTRDKPDQTYCENILKVFQKNDIRGFFYIGGNDSSETIRVILDAAKKSSFELKGFHIPKTIDNDLMENDHTPGFPSAARFVIKAVMGLELDSASLPGIHLVVIMGRNAGFLTMAAAFGGAHRIYIPEEIFDLEMFMKEVKETSDRYGRAIIAVSEGIADKDGNLIAASLLKRKEVDAHGNVHLSSLPLGDMLSELLKEKLKITRVRSDTFGYAQRCYPDRSPIDEQEARLVGEKAVEYFLAGNISSGSITISRVSNKPYQSAIGITDLEKVANKTRKLPREFYDAGQKTITQAGLDYLRPLVGELPAIERL